MYSIENLQQRLEFKKSKKYYVPRVLPFWAAVGYLPYLAFTITKWTIPVAISFIMVMASSVYFVIIYTKYIISKKIYLAIDSSGISNEGVLIKWDEIEYYATLKVGRPLNLYLTLTLVADNITVVRIPLYDLNIDDTQIREYISTYNTNHLIEDKGTSKE